MAPARHKVFVRANSPRYLVVWDLHWQIVEWRPLEPRADPRAALEAAVRRLALDGWQAESGGEFGFTFVRRSDERRLLAVTVRDPHRVGAQSFSPFGPASPM